MLETRKPFLKSNVPATNPAPNHTDMPMTTSLSTTNGRTSDNAESPDYFSSFPSYQSRNRTTGQHAL